MEINHRKMRSTNLTKSVGRKKTLKKKQACPTFDKENLLKQINDEINKGLEIRYINTTMKDLCVKNEENACIPIHRTNQMKFIIKSLITENTGLLEKCEQNSKKITNMKKSHEFCQIQEMKTLCDSYRQEISRMKKVYGELKAMRRVVRLKKREWMRKKKYKEIKNNELLGELSEGEKILEEQIDELKEEVSKARRKNMEGNQKKGKLLKEIYDIRKAIQEEMQSGRVEESEEEEKYLMLGKTTIIKESPKEEENDEEGEEEEADSTSSASKSEDEYSNFYEEQSLSN